jgi:DNA-binding transcriptional LysR family regulator
MLEVRRLRLLSQLARHGTIAEVAKVVGYTPSAISQALAQLEREAGVTLLERDGRRVRLTPAATALAARTDRVLAELDAAEAELAAEGESVRGELTIGAFPSAAAAVVAPAIAELSSQHPELFCSIREHEPEDGIALLRSGELDLLISESYEHVAGAPVGGLDEHLLVTEPLLLLMPNLPAVRQALALESLREAAWIAGLAGTQFAAALDQACRAAGFIPRIVHRADDAFLFHALVAAGLGIGLLPALACADCNGVQFVALRPAPPHRRVSALARRGTAERPAVRAALETLRRSAQEPAENLKSRVRSGA